MASPTTTCDKPAPRKSTSQNTNTQPFAVPVVNNAPKQMEESTLSIPSELPTQPPAVTSLPFPERIPRYKSNLGNNQSYTIQGIAPERSPHNPLVQRTGFPFDVYAKSWVPSMLQAINEEPADNVFTTESKYKIDYGSYIKTFAGGDILELEPNIDREWLDESQSPLSELTERSYMRHFVALLHCEYAAKQKENEQYALYKVPLQVVPIPHHGHLWALSIPGLREDSPLIEMGDTLQIRQIWVDSIGNLIQMPASQLGENGPCVIHRTWTRQQHDASVHSVSRVNETVYLRMDAQEQLVSYFTDMGLSMVVNVVFPLQQRVLQRQYRALLRVDRSLISAQQSQQDNLDR